MQTQSISDIRTRIESKNSFPNFGALKPPSLGIPRDSGKLDIAQEWSGSVCSPWNVKELELVPDGFPLERTHREIHDNPSDVALRISGVLQRLSIQAEYCSEKAKAKCRTSDMVSFRIRLYAGSESGQPVIVEIQRRSGPASSFMSSCRAILDAAEGKEVKPDGKKLPFCKPISEMKCLRNASVPCDDFGAGALDRTMDMLRSNNRDLNILGLENLCNLTDPVKSSASCALNVSKTVLLDSEIDHLSIRDEIRVLTERDGFGHEDHFVAQHADSLRHLSLKVFANALSICSKDGCLTKAVQEQQWFTESLVPSLLDEIRRVDESSANDAYLASSCLLSLISCSEVVRKHVLSNDGVLLLENALNFGLIRHALLANETQRCLEVIS